MFLYTFGALEATFGANLQVGSTAWLEQHEALERLNLQAHHNVRCHGDEFVMAALVAFDKLPLLVHEALVSEVIALRKVARFSFFTMLPDLPCTEFLRNKAGEQLKHSLQARGRCGKSASTRTWRGEWTASPSTCLYPMRSASPRARAQTRSSDWMANCHWQDPHDLNARRRQGSRPIM